jgi:4-hydroxybenzoate polyprenyltransferase
MASVLNKLSAWGRLVRLPNLLSAWGDPVAGFVLVWVVTRGVGVWDRSSGIAPHLPRLIFAALASLVLYAMGMVQNDLAHANRDRASRPNRPIVSGAVSPREASLGIVLLTLLGMGLAYFTRPDAAHQLAPLVRSSAMIVALMLVVAITFYNYVAAFHRAIAPTAMGLCRSLSVLLGATAADPTIFDRADLVPLWPVWVAVVGVGVYIAFVTAIAARETETRRIGPIRWAPTLVLFVGIEIAVVMVLRSLADMPAELSLPPATADLPFDPALVAPQPGPDIVQHAPWILLGQGAIVWAMFCSTRLRGICTPPQTGKTIGMFIRGMLLIQAMLIATAGVFGGVIAGIVLLGWPINRLLSRKFPPS